MGYYIVYKLLIYDLKKEFQSEIKASIKENQCTIIKISKPAIENYLVDDGKELFYEDSYYDIIKSEEQGNNIVFYCLDDKKEDSLFRLYCKHIKDHYSNNNHGKQPVKSTKKVANNLVKLAFSEPNLLFSTNKKDQIANIFYFESDYQCPIKKMLLPPKL